MQADIMNSELIIVARTDAYSAKLIDNDSDPVDQPFILGLSEGLGEKQVTFVEAGEHAIKTQLKGERAQKVLEQWTTKAPKMGLSDARAFAKQLGFVLSFDWDKCRTEEGYYYIKGCMDLCVARCLVLKIFLKQN